MLQITAACVCDAGAHKDNSRINLLFGGQILPEANGGLPSIPSVKFNSAQPFTAAVADGSASPVFGETAAFHAVGTFRSFAQQIAGTEDMKALLLRAHADIISDGTARSAPMYAAAAAVCIRGDTVLLTDAGDCRVYLRRGRALYLLSSPAPETAQFLGSADEALHPHVVSGPLRSGDRILLCTRSLPDCAAEYDILKALAAPLSPTAVLGQLVLLIRAASAGAPVSAILLDVGT